MLDSRAGGAAGDERARARARAKERRSCACGEREGGGGGGSLGVPLGSFERDISVPQLYLT